MKYTLLILILILMNSFAIAACKVSVNADEKYNLASILESKGYELVHSLDQANIEVSIDAHNYAWSDSGDVFSYAVPQISTGSLGTGSCQYIDVWSFSARDNVFQKRFAIKTMLHLIKEKWPVEIVQ